MLNVMLNSPKAKTAFYLTKAMKSLIMKEEYANFFSCPFHLFMSNYGWVCMDFSSR